MKRRNHISLRAGLLFALPAAVYMLIFVGYPMIQNFILSFKNVDVYTFSDTAKQSFVGFSNYTELFAGEEAILSTAIINTLIFTVISIFFQFFIGFGLAIKIGLSLKERLWVFLTAEAFLHRR